MLRLFSRFAALWVLLGAASQALAQVDAQVADLNSQALEAYQALDMDTARAKLDQAIGIAQQNGLMGPVVAQSFMSMGVVQITGFNDRDQGVSAFIAALCTQPDVQLDPLLSTPDVAQAFGQAQQDARAGACGPGAVPVGPPPQQMGPPPGGMGPQPPMMDAGPGAYDNECPPGVACEGDGRDRPDRKDFARFFVNLQFDLGMAYVGPGMEADSDPPFDDIFETMNVLLWDFNEQTGMPVPRPDPANPAVQDTETRFFFDDTSAWVPDKDSFDDFEQFAIELDAMGNEVIDPATGQPKVKLDSSGFPVVVIDRGLTPVPGNCKADGTVTGPGGVEGPNGVVFTTVPETPPFASRYCVRVEKPGLVMNPALRLNPGYFLTEGFALSLPLRFQFDAGKGSFSHMLIGLRGEVLFSEPEATGIFPGWFFGVTYGQIQAKPPPQNPMRPAPYVISGPMGLHTGMNLRWRFIRNFGLIFSPEIDIQLPNFMFNLDFAIGPEGAF